MGASARRSSACHAPSSPPSEGWKSRCRPRWQLLCSTAWKLCRRHRVACNNEAVLSYFLPNLEMQRALQVFRHRGPQALKDRLDRSLVRMALPRWSATRIVDGGWSWIRGGESDPYISTYVLFGLGRARLAGITVPDETFTTRAHEYLRKFCAG
jgi:hypothetical protein